MTEKGYHRRAEPLVCLVVQALLCETPFQWALQCDTATWTLNARLRTSTHMPLPRTPGQPSSSFTAGAGQPRSLHTLTSGHKADGQEHCSLFFPLGRFSLSTVFQGPRPK